MVRNMNPSTHMIANNMISSLGFNTEEHITAFKESKSGIQAYETLGETFYVSAINENHLKAEWEKLQIKKNCSKLEQLFILSISKTLSQTPISITGEDSLIIFSTTKGNIDGLYKKNNPMVLLGKMANKIRYHFKMVNNPEVISTACISGTLACVIAHRYIQSGKYKNVIVTGGDILSDFTLSGFNSFKALSSKPCKPFDKNRTGVNLGEGVGTILFSSEKQVKNNSITVKGGASTNDANHISGPSRTGDGLFYAIQESMDQAEINADQIGYISAHGTATPYNDEMEAKAFNWAKLQDVPLNSFKGYIGHTLGGAGILEAIAAIESLERNELYTSLGFEDIGVSQPINVLKAYQSKKMNFVLKTASGFGGCNASIVFHKE